jgi:hypothetical protein
MRCVEKAIGQIHTPAEQLGAEQERTVRLIAHQNSVRAESLEDIGDKPLATMQPSLLRCVFHKSYARHGAQAALLLPRRKSEGSQTD